MQDGLLTPEEMASCSQAQIEFLVRKRTTQGASNSVVPAPPRRTSSSPRPASQRPPSPVPAANGWGQSPQPQVRAGRGARLRTVLFKACSASPACVPMRALSASCSAQDQAVHAIACASHFVFNSMRRAAVPHNFPLHPDHAAKAFQGGNGEEAMSAEQLELLREYLRAQEEQEALLQAQVENLKREVGAEALVGVCGCWGSWAG